MDMSNVLNVGLGFVFGAGSDNIIVKGGKALEQVRKWDAVESRINELQEKILADQKMTPGEAYRATYDPGNIPEFLKDVWKGKEKLISPVHVIGSFNISARVNADGKTMTLTVYDSKTISSLSDGNLDKKANRVRDNNDPKPLTTQYIRFIWTQPIQ